MKKEKKGISTIKTKNLWSLDWNRSFLRFLYTKFCIINLLNRSFFSNKVIFFNSKKRFYVSIPRDDRALFVARKYNLHGPLCSYFRQLYIKNSTILSTTLFNTLFLSPRFSLSSLSVPRKIETPG